MSTETDRRAGADQRLLGLLRAAQETPEAAAGWRDLARAAARAGDMDLAGYALEAAFPGVPRADPEVVLVATRLGLAPGDPRGALPWVQDPPPTAPVQGPRQVARPVVSPGGAFVAFAGAYQVAIFELETGACRARLPTEEHAPAPWWRAEGELEWLRVEGLGAFVRSRVRVEDLPLGFAPGDPAAWQDLLRQDTDRQPVVPLRGLVGGWILATSSPKQAPCLALLSPEGRRFRVQAPHAVFEYQVGPHSVVVGPGGAVAYAQVRTEGPSPSTALVVIEPGEACADPGGAGEGDGAPAPRASLALDHPLELVGWDEASFVWLRRDRDQPGRGWLCAAAGPGEVPRWEVPIDLGAGEGATGLTPAGQVVWTRPGAARLLSQEGGGVEAEVELPPGCRAHPLDARRLLAVRAGRFQVVGLTEAGGGSPGPAGSPRVVDDPRPLPGADLEIAGVTVLASPPRVLVVRRQGAVVLRDLATGAQRDAGRIDPPRSLERSLPLAVDPAQRHLLTTSASGPQVFDLEALEVVRRLAWGERVGKHLVRCLALLDGLRLAVGEHSGRLRVVDLEREAVTFDRVLEPRAGPVTQLVAHPDGEHLAVLHGKQGLVLDVALGADPEAAVPRWKVEVPKRTVMNWALAPDPEGYYLFEPRIGAFRLRRGRAEVEMLWQGGDAMGRPLLLAPAADLAVWHRRGPRSAQHPVRAVRLSDGADLGGLPVSWSMQAPEMWAYDPVHATVLAGEGEALRRFELPG